MPEGVPPTNAGHFARGAALGLVFALPAALFFWGFTVDDALIIARVASNLASGVGYRMNPGGPEVDAVTPLGYAHLVALGGAGGPLEMFARSKDLGFLAWLAAAAWLGGLLPRDRVARTMALALLGMSAPLAAWAGSGMETGLVTLLGALALGRHPAFALFGGIAAGLRPELIPWALTLAVGRACLGEAERRVRLERGALWGALAIGPALAVATVRWSWFGSAAPLSVLAKPSDLAHGLRYAAGAFFFTGAPLLLLAPRALRRADGWTRVLTLSVAAHFVALVLAGGDWMALFRLAVPVLPTALLAGARLVDTGSLVAPLVRAGVAVVVSLVLAGYKGLPARTIVEQRSALIESARGPLAKARSVAALDVGWVGAATKAPVLDLAGVTDPLVARLPGGHTSKQVPEGLLEARGVDAIVLFLAPGARVEDPWHDSRFHHVVESRIASYPLMETFRVREVLPLRANGQFYLVVAR